MTSANLFHGERMHFSFFCEVVMRSMILMIIYKAEVTGFEKCRNRRHFFLSFVLFKRVLGFQCPVLMSK